MSPERLCPPFSWATVLDAQIPWQMLCSSLQRPFSVVRGRDCVLGFLDPIFRGRLWLIYSRLLQTNHTLRKSNSHSWFINGSHHSFENIYLRPDYFLLHLHSHYHSQFCVCYCKNSWDEMMSSLRFPLFWKRSSTRSPPYPPKPSIWELPQVQLCLQRHRKHFFIHSLIHLQQPSQMFLWCKTNW